jgi:hypothetical protein
MVLMQRAAPPLVRTFASFGRDPRHWQLMALGGRFLLSFLTSDFGAKRNLERHNGKSAVLEHAWDMGWCEAAGEYANTLVKRWDKEAIELTKLTGRNVDEIRAKMASPGYSADAVKGIKIEQPQPKKTWWQRLWGNG